MSDRLVVKVVRAETKVLGKGRVHAVVSTESEDRDKDIIRSAGWVLEHFDRHPVLISSHNYRELTSQIGHWEGMKVAGKHLEGEAVYYVGEGNADADWGFNLASKGWAAYSVGFIPDMSKTKELDGGGLEFNSQELLEVSQVTIPSNRDALQMIKGAHPVVQEIISGTLGDLSLWPPTPNDVNFLQVGGGHFHDHTEANTTVRSPGEGTFWVVRSNHQHSHEHEHEDGDDDDGDGKMSHEHEHDHDHDHDHGDDDDDKALDLSLVDLTKLADLLMVRLNLPKVTPPEGVEVVVDEDFIRSTVEEAVKEAFNGD